MRASEQRRVPLDAVVGVVAGIAATDPGEPAQGAAGDDGVPDTEDPGDDQ
jgi:hypothetical protein